MNIFLSYGSLPEGILLSKNDDFETEPFSGHYINHGFGVLTFEIEFSTVIYKVDIDLGTFLNIKHTG